MMPRREKERSTDLWSGFVILFRNVKLSALRHPWLAFLVLTPAIIAGYVYIVGQFHPEPATKSLLDSILGGTIASAATYSLVRSFFLVEKGLGIKEWLNFGPAKVWIIPSYLKHPSSRSAQKDYFVVPPFDAQAAHYLTEMLKSAGYRYPMRDIRGSHWFDENILYDNIVTFCLPERNQYSRLFLGLYEEILSPNKLENLDGILDSDNYMKYIHDDECKFNYFGLHHERRRNYSEWKIKDYCDPDGVFRQSQLNAHPDENVHKPGKDITDWCLIVKGPNPFNPDATFLAICGIHGIGTLGGTMYINENRHKLFQYYNEQVQVHLLHVHYRTPVGASNYVDSKIKYIFKQCTYTDFPADRIRQVRISHAASR